ncbi:MAG: aldo/keto reductase [Pseudomonadota bacterium]
MLYRKIKKNGDDLSILGFGCMRLPQKKGTPGDGKIDEERAEKQILYAMDQGVNYFDTAMPYHLGASELFLGKVFSSETRDKVKLATKLPHFLVKKPEDMDLLLNAQLKKLKTDHIDYYLIHALERKSWDKLRPFGVLEFLEKAKREQRIVNAGFSFHGDRETFKEIIDAYDWEVCQIQYNYLDEQNQAGRQGLKYAASKEVGVIIMEPLRGGNIAGKIPPEVKSIWEQGDEKRTPAEWALRWVWNHPEVSVVLSGMNEEEHIEENIRIACEAYPDSLDEDELQLINRVKIKYKEIMKVGCTGCNYCMPCPSGVNIPSCFEIYNSAHMFGDVRTSRILYLMFLSGVANEPAKASLCQKCGECEEVCPQHLPIRESLERVAKEFEGKWLKPTAWLVKRMMSFLKWKDLRRAKKGR